jgi:hypothetical protein
MGVGVNESHCVWYGSPQAISLVAILGMVWFPREGATSGHTIPSMV